MQDWKEYLSELMGEQVRAMPDPSAARRLSVGITAIYDVFRGELLGQNVMFIAPKTLGGPSLSDLLRHYRVLRKNLDGEIIYILPSVNRYEMRRLIAEHIPFVVSGRQVFLPRNAVFLRTSLSSGRGGTDVENPVSPRAQALLLFHLQIQPLTGLTQVEIADLLQWTPMSVSRAVQELQHKRLCHTLPEGRANTLSMSGGRELWERAETWLTSPVRRRCFVHFNKKNAREYLYGAGMTALSQYTMIGEDPVPVLAIRDRAFPHLQESGLISVRPYRDDDSVQVELWKYDPAPLAKDKTVDRLSLYLSLKGHPDERVEGALNDLMKEMPWRQ